MVAPKKKVAPKKLAPKKATATTRKRPQLDKMANGSGGYNKTISKPQGPVAGNKRPQLDKMSPGTGRVRQRLYDNNLVGVPPRYSMDKNRPSFTTGASADRANAQRLTNKKDWDKQEVALRVTTRGRRRSGVGK